MRVAVQDRVADAVLTMFDGREPVQALPWLWLVGVVVCAPLAVWQVFTGLSRWWTRLLVGAPVALVFLAVWPACVAAAAGYALLCLAHDRGPLADRA